MNSINSNFIMIDHGFMDRTGTMYTGFVGIFQRVGQTEPTIAQKVILEDARKENKMICFGSVDEVVKVLNESR